MICPSVCPFDQGELIAALTAARSLATPLAKGRADLALSNYRAAKGDLSAVLGARAQVLEARLRLIDLQTQRDGVTTRLNSLIAD